MISPTGLVDAYDVPAEKVLVIPPGVELATWSTSSSGPRDDDVVRILFVGADLDRKGGETLLRAFRNARLRASSSHQSRSNVELHLVTKSAVADEAGVHAYSQMEPNSPELRELYRRCDIFCLPTMADMLPLVLCEAGAAGLPLVSTSVAGIPEIVQDGTTGIIVPPGDVEALTKALTTLIEQPELRRRLGAGAAAHIRANFEAGRNADRLVELLERVATPRSGTLQSTEAAVHAATSSRN